MMEVRDWKTNQLIDIDPYDLGISLGYQVGKNFIVTILDPATEIVVGIY